MEESAEAFHEDEHAESDSHENVVDDEHGWDHPRRGLEPHHGDGVVEEYFGQLTVSKGKSPETEVTGRVTDGTEGVFDGLDHAVDEHFAEAMLFGTSFWQDLFKDNFVLSEI